MKQILFMVMFLTFTYSGIAQVVKPNLPWIDLSNESSRQVIISQGTTDLYNGHPTTIMMDDNRTILCTWTAGHGGPVSFLYKSTDAGKTWNKMPIPSDWKIMRNCPSIYRLTDKKGKERIFVFAAHPKMGMSYSEDNGMTWSKVKSLDIPCVMAFSSIVKLNNGDYLGMYHRGENDVDGSNLAIWQSISHDGGLTWDTPTKVGEMFDRAPCEPCVFRSPCKRKLVCITRENNRIGNSLIMTSADEGKTWTPLKETQWGITGDRHVIKILPDGRLIAAFRDMANNSPTKGHFVAWVGHYKDLWEETSGQYRIKLMHSYQGSDCGYPGLEIFPDGTVLAITYIKIRPGKQKHSIVSTRFNIYETDDMIY